VPTSVGTNGVGRGAGTSRNDSVVSRLHGCGPLPSSLNRRPTPISCFVYTRTMVLHIPGGYP